MVYARLGDNSIIDVINPATGRGQYGGETLEQVQKEYPGACVMPLAEYCADKAKRQDTPVEWSEVTEEHYHEMLNVLPPAAWQGGAFMVGEACDHHAGTGRPRFQALRRKPEFSHEGVRIRTGSTYWASSRPMTHAEFCAMFGKTANCYVE